MPSAPAHPRRRAASSSAPRRGRPATHMRGGRLIFQRAAQKMLNGQLASHLFGKTQGYWLRGELAPTAYRRRVDALEGQVRQLVAFCAAALIDGVLRPLNGKPRRIRSDEDWVEAVENLEGLRDMLTHKVAGVAPRAMTAAERRELARFCAARAARGAPCAAPCGKVRGLVRMLRGKPAVRCAVVVGVAARDAGARAAARGIVSREKARARAKVESRSSPAPRGSAYASTVPAGLPFQDLRFMAIRRQADAVGARLIGRQGKTMSRARAAE